MREKLITFAITEEEKEKLEEAARSKRLCTGSFIRSVSLEKADEILEVQK